MGWRFSTCIMMTGFERIVASLLVLTFTTFLAREGTREKMTRKECG